MKNKTLLLFAIVIIIVCNVYGQNTPQQIGVDDFTLNYQGVELKLGQAVSTVSILNKTINKQKEEMWGYPATVWLYDGLKFYSYGWNEFGALKDLKIASIINDKAVGVLTKRGVKIGDKIEKVFELYGPKTPYHNQDTTWVQYQYDLPVDNPSGLYITYILGFDYKDGIVTRIGVNIAPLI